MTPRTNTAAIDKGLGMHKGLPILSIRPESRGMEGGFHKAMDATGAYEVEPGGFVWHGLKSVHKSDRYDLVEWGDDDDRPEGVKAGTPRGFDLVQIFKVVGVAYTTEEAIGADVHASMEAVAALEASKRGQTSLPFGAADEPLNPNVSADVGQKVDAALAHVTEIRPGVLDDEGAGEGEPSGD